MRLADTEATCRHCREPITWGHDRWWHRAGWFSLCKNGQTHAEPAEGVARP